MKNLKKSILERAIVTRTYYTDPHGTPDPGDTYIVIEARELPGLGEYVFLESDMTGEPEDIYVLADQNNEDHFRAAEDGYNSTTTTYQYVNVNKSLDEIREILKNMKNCLQTLVNSLRF